MPVRVKLLKGGGEGAEWVDYSDIHRMQFLELAHRAHGGESATTTAVFDDHHGEVGNELDLPEGLERKQMAAHNVVTFEELATDPPTVIGRGRYGSKTVEEGDHNLPRGRQVTLLIDDANMHLRGMPFLTVQTRPEETDVERMTWLLETFLQGSPRLTTDLTSRISSSEPVTMPAQEYEVGTHPVDVVGDCLRQSGKTGFVTVDDELYYAPVDDMSYVASMRISDREEEHDFTCTGSVPASCELDEGDMTLIETPNGGLEMGDTTNWTISSVSHSVEATGAPEGDYFLQVNGAGFCRIDPWAGVTFHAGQPYVIRFRHSSLATTGAVHFGVAGGDETVQDGYGSEPGAWHVGCIAWTPEEETDGANVHFGIAAIGGSDNFELDDIRLYTASDTAAVNCTFPPIHPKSIEEGQELMSVGVLKYAGGKVVTETRPSVVDDYDYWGEVINDDQVKDPTAAAARLSAIMDQQQYEGRTYDLGVMLTATQVNLVKPGQMIQVKSYRLPDADDQFVWRRIAELRRVWMGPSNWLHLFKLDRPLRNGMRTYGSSAGGNMGGAAMATKPSTASEMPYDGTGSGSSAETVQEAIDEALAAVDPDQYLLTTEGEQGKVHAHGAMGTTETFDPADGNLHTGTLDDDCAFTLAVPPSARGGSPSYAIIELAITGSGSHDWSWTDPIEWAGGVEPDPPGDGELVRVLLEMWDGTTWYGAVVGGGAPVPVAASDLSTRWEPVGFPDGTIWVLDDGTPIMAEVPI